MLRESLPLLAANADLAKYARWCIESADILERNDGTKHNQHGTSNAYFGDAYMKTWQQAHEYAFLNCPGLVELLEPQPVSYGLQPIPRVLDMLRAVAERAACVKRPGEKMSVEEANEVAKLLADKHGRQFLDGGCREWARQIGCSEGTTRKTALWQQTMERSGRGRKGTGPKTSGVISFTDKVESTVGQGEEHEMLKELIRQQEADCEPSPFKDDLSDRPRRVRQHKRL